MGSSTPRPLLPRAPLPGRLAQLLLAWIPVWVVYAIVAHETTTLSWGHAIGAGIRAGITASLLGLWVWALTRRVEWPRRPGVRFVTIHAVAATVFAFGWVSSVDFMETLLAGESPFWAYWQAPNFAPRVGIGFWLYIATAGVSYAIRSTESLHRERERAARAETAVVSAQLKNLRSQLRPHFLFNALNSISALLGLDPARAERAVDLLSVLLRRSLEEERPTVPLSDECSFVETYLEFERIRFGERLRVSMHITPDCGATLVPTFGLQTLVENAIRHGLTPSEGPTSIEIRAEPVGSLLRLTVTDDGPGTDADRPIGDGRVGLTNLRARIATHFGPDGRLECHSGPGAGFRAVVMVPNSP